MPLQGDQLSRMTIRGFKSIKNCDISFGKINVLIGSNGAGKSNFISAFSFLQKNRQNSRSVSSKYAFPHFCASFEAVSI